MSITRLRISGALALLVNLSEFPALTCLELHCSHIHAISSLAPDNRVERLVLHIAAYAVGGHTTSDWFSPADSLIADCTMPALRQVELQIGNTYGQALPFDLESLKLQFPQLKARGLFAVSEHRLSFPYI
ncbi:hypothetical protein FB451DRAFT_1227020 [Mycena latifolia]|nr:hypothetical protein FB451DRAFT_1227020 [Mycena latifolia]